jgi:hypothetical protein
MRDMSENETNPTEEWIARMARDHYNPPPPTPREEMWASLEARLQSGEPRDAGDGSVVPLRPRTRSVASGWWLALAASVVLAVGVGIGRWSSPAVPGPGVGPSVAEAPAPTRSGTPRPTVGRWAAAETLAESEPLLAMVRADVARGAVDAEVGDWARRLLGETRFLLDSGLPLDPQVRSLLEDLELILLQTSLVGDSQVAGPRAEEELELLRQGMDDKDVITRIQAVLPTVGTGAGI